MEYSASFTTALGLEYSPGLLTCAAMVESLSRVLAQLHLVDAPLARQVRRAGTAIATAIAAARLAPRGQAVRHYRRARAQAVALIEHLQATDSPSYYPVTGRRETIQHATRIIHLIDADAC
jgi:hypothetical protein